MIKKFWPFSMLESKLYKSAIHNFFLRALIFASTYYNDWHHYYGTSALYLLTMLMVMAAHITLAQGTQIISQLHWSRELRKCREAAKNHQPFYIVLERTGFLNSCSTLFQMIWLNNAEKHRAEYLWLSYS